jgi:hypothetical protein
MQPPYLHISEQVLTDFADGKSLYKKYILSVEDMSSLSAYQAIEKSGKYLPFNCIIFTRCDKVVPGLGATNLLLLLLLLF